LFIIPAYNEEALIGDTLGAIDAAARAVGEAFESIMADDASTDQPAVIARELALGWSQ
jgi:glycosyltransferase involved in cell wall biosynthesis